MNPLDIIPADSPPPLSSAQPLPYGLTFSNGAWALAPNLTPQDLLPIAAFSDLLSQRALTLRYRVLLYVYHAGDATAKTEQQRQKAVVEFAMQAGWHSTEQSVRQVLSDLRGIEAVIDHAERQGVALTPSTARTLARLRHDPARQQQIIDGVATGDVQATATAIAAEVNGIGYYDQLAADALADLQRAVDILATYGTDKQKRAAVECARRLNR